MFFYLLFIFLEIAKDERTVVCPTVDYIDHKDFHYRGVDPYIRGTFNWRFDYKERAITQEMKKARTDPTGGVKYEKKVFFICLFFFYNLNFHNAGLCRCFTNKKIDLMIIIHNSSKQGPSLKTSLYFLYTSLLNCLS